MIAYRGLSRKNTRTEKIADMVHVSSQPCIFALKMINKIKEFDPEEYIKVCVVLENLDKQQFKAYNL